MTIITIRFDPPSSTNFVDGAKNPSQQSGTLPILQVPIRLTNIWCGRPDEIMDPLPKLVVEGGPNLMVIMVISIPTVY